MALELKSVSRSVQGRTHIRPTDLMLERGTMNVLLGPTLSGKTSLMRLMAGLDAPTSGSIFWNGADVTGHRVQDRKVAMVYQQFINYPAMSVYDNIASPMRLMSKSKAEIDRAVRETAELIRGHDWALMRGVGHLPMVDKPAEFTALLDTFLARIGHG